MYKINPKLNKNRLSDYEVRDDHHGHYNGIGNKIYEYRFCTACRTLLCNDLSHNQIELHPALRIPKKSANKQKWNIFLGLIEKFGMANIRSNRH